MTAFVIGARNCLVEKVNGNKKLREMASSDLVGTYQNDNTSVVHGEKLSCDYWSYNQLTIELTMFTISFSFVTFIFRKISCHCEKIAFCKKYIKKCPFLPLGGWLQQNIFT